MMEIRPFQEGDIAEVTAIEESVFPTPWSREAFLKFSKDPHYRIRVALQSAEIAGYLVAQIVGNEAELHNIAVAAHHQRQEVGTELLKDFLREAGQLSVNEVFLMVRASNHPAQIFYQKFQFESCGRRPNAYQNPPEEALIFRKKLMVKLAQKA